MNQAQISLEIHNLVEIWEELTKLHSELFELTCDEYECLLASDIELLNEKVEAKSILLERVAKLDEIRKNRVKEINNSGYFQEKITKAAQLIRLCVENNIENAKHLEKYNLLLIDIIENIQKQNKKNQVFLNKAMRTLGQLKNGFTGQKSITTYGSNGKTITKNV